MNDKLPVMAFDAEEAGRVHAQELINTLAIEFHTAGAFASARAQARRALLEVLDAADPLQTIETTRLNAASEEAQRCYTDESLQRRKDRGSLQDPLFPPGQSNHWD